MAKKLEHAMIHACVDVDDDLELAKSIARMAVECGVDVIESGTPLLYSCGYESLRELKKIAGDDHPLVADYKAQDGTYFMFNSARKNGADWATVSVVCNDGGTIAAVRSGKETGIKVIGDLFAVPVPELAKRAREVEALGVDMVLIHYGADELREHICPGRNEYDGVQEVADAVKIPVAVVCDSNETAAEAIRRGADWILFSRCIRQAEPENYEKCRSFVQAIREADREYNAQHRG